MGLDMYLSADLYVSQYKEKDKNLSSKIVEILNDVPEGIGIDGVSVRVGYWRKANAIHKWFVDNVQYGVDQCQRSYVSRDKLVELLETCEKVKNDHGLAPDLLPTSSGFFFGSTDYDDQYFSDIDDTIDIIKKALELPEYYTLEYQASW